MLKEISEKIDYDLIEKLPEKVANIIEILKHEFGYIEDSDIKEKIKEILKKIKGQNIINFSNYTHEIIDSNQLNNILNLLNKSEYKEINDTKYRLSKYDEFLCFFEKEFEITKQSSIFEFSIISLVVIERENFEKFEEERKKCPNRVDRILYHGTSVEPISCILTDIFKKSEKRCYQHGKGVYFTDILDYCWFYGGENNRANKNKIPGIGETFTLIFSFIYYNKKKLRKVKDHKYTPKKNEINFAYAGAEFETLEKPDKTKFYGTEYVIWDLDQICPFMSAKLERNEYCVIWRDNNFSSNPFYNNKFDKIFKDFLKERIRYIKQECKYNIYICETTEKALNIAKRKKYNKIILISNVGTSLEGKDFIEEVRKILGSNVIALFLAYNIAHLEWIKEYKNALFSNEPKFYEKYIECFNDNNIKNNLNELIKSVEEHYKVKFNFDDNFLDYPYFMESGKFSDLTF